VIAAIALLLGTGIVHADPCKLTIESNDQMQYSAHELAAPPQCQEVEVTLRNVGKLPANVMGHDWVLARASDMPAIVNAGLSAGIGHGYIPANDKRVVAATRLVGGGDSATVRFSTSALQPGERYSFFCTSPGHSAAMRGRFLFGDSARLARAGKPEAQPQ
jgi:azurin